MIIYCVVEMMKYVDVDNRKHKKESNTFRETRSPTH